MGPWQTGTPASYEWDGTCSLWLQMPPEKKASLMLADFLLFNKKPDTWIFTRRLMIYFNISNEFHFVKALSPLPPKHPIIELREIDPVWGLWIIPWCDSNNTGLSDGFEGTGKNQAIIFITSIQTWDLTSIRAVTSLCAMTYVPVSLTGCELVKARDWVFLALGP